MRVMIHHHRTTFRPTVTTILFGAFLLVSSMEESQPETVRRLAKKNPVVFLTVSSLASYPEEVERLLELNWYDIPEDLMSNEDSTIQLFSHEPAENTSDYLVSVHPRYYSEGYYRTSVQFPRHSFDEKNMTGECLGFWIALTVKERVISKSCIRAYPNWMHDMRDAIENKTLIDLAIPGTHNAGSYAHYDPDEDTVLNRYLVTQDENIWNQLVYGIRCLDLRISFEKVRGVTDRFWITHGVFRTKIPIREVFDQVKSFLNSTKEFIIMDFHRFVRGFSGGRALTRHRSLIRVIERELGDYMIPVALSPWVKLQELWELDKRLFVGYASNSHRSRSRYLFPPVKHLWGDKDNVADLFSFLNSNVCNKEQGKLTSAMAQLTPTTAGAIFDSYGGLRKMAHDVNRQITRWFRDIWWNCANIISTDFFLGNNIISEAIEINKKKFLY